MSVDTEPQPPMEPNFAPSSSHSYCHVDDPSLPTYKNQEESLEEAIRKLRQQAQNDGRGLPITHYPYGDRITRRKSPKALSPYNLRKDIVTMYFDAIQTKNDEVIALLLQLGMVTTETTDKEGRTPLLAAVGAGNLRTVQQLMDFNANVNAYGVKPCVQHGRGKPVTIYRTPLQLAAESGNLTMTRLLMETYHADDSQIAPDGQHALRLAASNGHREIVQYLPTRRGGGWRRWKMKHRDAVQRFKRAGKGTYQFFEYLLWYFPKIFVWYIPKYAIVLPAIGGARWLREHHREIPRKIKKWLKKVARYAGYFVETIRSVMRVIPRIAWRFIKAIPTAIKTILLWFWKSAKICGVSLKNIFARFFSFLHTVFMAIATFFQNLTMGDIFQGMLTFMRAILVDLPKVLWSCLCGFTHLSKKVLKALLGTIGRILWALAKGVVHFFVYVPRKLGDMSVACFESLAAGCKEVMIWYDPKRA